MSRGVINDFERERLMQWCLDLHGREDLPRDVRQAAFRNVRLLHKGRSPARVRQLEKRKGLAR